MKVYFVILVFMLMKKKKRREAYDSSRSNTSTEDPKQVIPKNDSVAFTYAT